MPHLPSAPIRVHGLLSRGEMKCCQKNKVRSTLHPAEAPMKTFPLLVIAGLLHFLFMLGELFPWPIPLVLRKMLDRLPKDPLSPKLSAKQLDLVANAVRNAGIY